MALDTLRPAERLAFVLHDVFAVPFEEIGGIVGRSSNAAEQLASHARQKVQGSGPAPDTDPARQRAVVDAFLATSRNGDFDALVALLDPGVVLQADSAAVRMGSPEEVRGAPAVAGVFSGRALAAQPALIDGAVGVVWAVGGRPKVAWDLTIRDGRIVHIDVLAAPDTRYVPDGSNHRSSTDGTRIRVGNLEALDGTPVVDIKPLLGRVGER